MQNKNQNLDPGNYNNQFEVDDAKSKLQFMLSWKWSRELVMHILSKKFVASHELTVSSSCLITAERLDNLLNHQIKSKMNLKRRT